MTNISVLKNKYWPESQIQAFRFIKGFLFIFFINFYGIATAQKVPSPFTFSGYLETYYSFDFNRPSDHLKPDFIYNFKRHNEFNINLGVVSGQYQKDKARSTVALMFGNYAQYNLADEPQWAQWIYEASIGLKISEKIWVDFGIMPSHIGFESAIGADNWHLTRSINAENTPYYLTGSRLSYAIDPKTDLTIWLTNGWQNIQKKDNLNSLSLGLKLDRKFSNKLSTSYANFFGDQSTSPIFQPRFFNNWVIMYTPEKWGFLVGADYGVDYYSTRSISWQGYTFSIRRNLNEHFILAARGEYYSDPKGIILSEGMKISGVSSNLDYQIQENALLRFEFRQFLSPDPVFTLPGGKFSIGNYAITSSLSIKF
jgi:hypothetical protein